jgi:rhodanese-related sulfurtransferase
MMKYIFSLLFFSIIASAQNPIDSILRKYNKNLVPMVNVEQFKKLKNPIILDTREVAEFAVSHIKNAKHIGFEKFKSTEILEKFKNFKDTIVVYCSLGVRSETIGAKLKKMGYKNVFNLYGGIFEWKNKGQIVVDKNQQLTENVHAFSKEWSKYLIKGKKIY